MTANESTRGYGPEHDRSTEPATSYTFSAHNKTPKSCAATAERVDRVYAGLVHSVDDLPAYVSSADLSDDLLLSQNIIGVALRELAEAGDCPLQLDAWSGASSSPRRYRVAVADTGGES